MYSNLKKALCESCSHSGVCSFKKAFEELNEKTNDLAKLLENREFTITVQCKHYLCNKGEFQW